MKTTDISVIAPSAAPAAAIAAAPGPAPAPNATPAPATSPAIVPIAGWAPTSVTATPSVRHSGMVPAVFDALRGVTEPAGAGQPLTDAQVGALAPFLAGAYELPEPVVREDLRATRILLGGPNGSKPNYAVTLGRDIYVGRPEDVQHITEWSGRRWLAHELGHTMQWRRGDVTGTDASRNRRDIAQYIGACVVGPHLSAGALPVATWSWVKSRLSGAADKPSFDSVFHDAHWMEREAEQHAQEFLAANP